MAGSFEYPGTESFVTGTTKSKSKEIRQALSLDGVLAFHMSLSQSSKSKAKSMFSFEPILPCYATKAIDLVKVFYGQIKDRKRTGECLEYLKEKYPLEGLNHLKRVKSKKLNTKSDHCNDTILNVVICPTTATTLDGLMSDEKLKSFVCDVGTTYVCQDAPITRQQFDHVSKYWPTGFHEDKRIKLLCSDDVFNKNDRKRHEKYCKLLDDYKESKDVTLVVNPSTERLLCVATDCTDTDGPLLHSVMVAVDMVAKYQGNGAYHHLKYIMDGDDCLRIGNHAQNDGVDNEYGMDNMRVIDDGCGMGDEHVINNGRGIDDGRGIEGYLCTGYEIYTSVEPCIMCSMALLHSRIQKLFYRKPNKNYGGLGSIYEIHAADGFNHHFDVFRVTNNEADVT